LRYSYEKKSLENSRNGVPMVDAKDHWDNLDHRLTLQYFIDPALNVYVTHSTGFKSGAFNSTSFTNPPVRPETVKAWEGGMKMGRRGLTLNGDVFHYDWKDIQIQRSVDPAVGTTLLQNAARGKIYGAEVELHADLGPSWFANFGATYTHGRYESFPAADVLVPRPGGGNISASLDVSGRPTYRTPEWTLNGGLNYEHEAMGGVFEAAGSAYYSSQFSWEPSNRLREKAHTLLNARASWSPADRRWKVSVWGDNLSDEFYFVNANTSTGGDTGTMGPPRRFGVTLSMKTN
jgi:iron complex outermembrane receptor protein